MRKTVKGICLALGVLASSPALAQPLSEPAKAALITALADERHAEAFYETVITKFGNVRPFSNIIEAERRHQEMIISLFRKYSLDVPSNSAKAGTSPKPVVPESLAEACKMGAEAEIANRELYNKNLLPPVADYSDITAVLTRLRDASDLNHLPAFQRCADRA